MKHLAVFVSGNGSNLQALIDACECGRLPGTRVSVVVCNHREAYALQRARAHGIPTIYHPFAPYRKAGTSRAEYDADLAAKLAAYPVDLIIQAGWMHILSMGFLKLYPGRVLNIHPALPGMFPGMHAIENAYEAYQRGEITHTGVMVHLVPDEGVDVGPVIAEEAVPIYSSDTLEDLETRMHATEHRLYVQVIASMLERL
jgi:phosphoribosylglycinamide formyltransferase 1